MNSPKAKKTETRRKTASSVFDTYCKESQKNEDLSVILAFFLGSCVTGSTALDFYSQYEGILKNSTAQNFKATGSEAKYNSLVSLTRLKRTITHISPR